MSSLCGRGRECVGRFLSSAGPWSEEERNVLKFLGDFVGCCHSHPATTILNSYYIYYRFFFIDNLVASSPGACMNMLGMSGPK